MSGEAEPTGLPSASTTWHANECTSVLRTLIRLFDCGCLQHSNQALRDVGAVAGFAAVTTVAGLQAATGLMAVTAVIGLMAACAHGHMPQQSWHRDGPHNTSSPHSTVH